MTNQQTAHAHPGESAPPAAVIPDPAQGKPNPLLTNLGYFRRYGEHLAQTGDKVAAWEKTEGDLRAAFGLRRFATYESFKVTFCNISNGKTRNLNRVTFLLPD